MHKLFFITIIALLVLVVSCKKETDWRDKFVGTYITTTYTEHSGPGAYDTIISNGDTQIVQQCACDTTYHNDTVYLKVQKASDDDSALVILNQKLYHDSFFPYFIRSADTTTFGQYSDDYYYAYFYQDSITLTHIYHIGVQNSYGDGWIGKKE